MKEDIKQNSVYRCNFSKELYRVTSVANHIHLVYYKKIGSKEIEECSPIYYFLENYSFCRNFYTVDKLEVMCEVISESCF